MYPILFPMNYDTLYTNPHCKKKLARKTYICKLGYIQITLYTLREQKDVGTEDEVATEV